MSDAQQMHTATKQQLVRADAAQRAQRAWALRVAGSTWAQVASAVDYADASTACRAVRQFFGQLPTIEADEQRRLWRDRLERLWNYADRDAKRGRPGAVRAGVAVAQRAASLDGLDAATRVEVGTDAREIEEIVRQIRVARGDLPDEADVLELEVLPNE